MFGSHLDLGGNRYRECYGLFFEEFEAGQRFVHRPGITVYQQDNVTEALATLNQAMIHFDEAYADKSEFRRPLIVSTITVRRAIGMAWRTFGQRRRILGWPEIRMTAPVFHGDTLYSRSEIVERQDEGEECGRLRVRTRVDNQDGRTVCDMVWDTEIFRRAAAPTDPSHGSAPRAFASHATAADGAFMETTGPYFDDFVPGQVFEHWPARRVSLAEAWAWAASSGDQAAVVIDPALGAGTGDGVLPEYLALGMGTATSTKTFGRVVANLQWSDIVMAGEVRDGDLLHARSTVTDSRPSGSRPDQGILTVRTEAETGEGRPVFSYQRKLLVYRAGGGPYAAAGYA
ncbi:MAG: MaoC family dehydratase [Azospirillaceae bacterium]